jgi:hypothetical protein
MVARGRRLFAAIHAGCALGLIAPFLPLLTMRSADRGVLGLAVIFGPPLTLFALVLLDHARIILRSRIVVHERGVDLTLPRFGGLRWMRASPPTSLAWSELQAVHRRPRGVRMQIVYYVLVTTQGVEHMFTRTVIARPDRVAAAIAERAGLPLVTC